MEFAYLCRARRSEVFDLKRADEINDGLYLKRGKGSGDEITLWTPRLKKAMKEAKAYNRDAPTPVTGAYFIHDKKGSSIKKNAFDSAWRRIRTEAMENGITVDGKNIKLEELFTFHDLKAKGISDHKDKHGGHRSGKMKRVYDRLPDLVKATK